MNNALISIATPLVLLHAFISLINPTTKEALESLNKYPDIIRRCAIINRFVDDLATSSVRFHIYLNSSHINLVSAPHFLIILVVNLG